MHRTTLGHNTEHKIFEKKITNFLKKNLGLLPIYGTKNYLALLIWNASLSWEFPKLPLFMKDKPFSVFLQKKQPPSTAIFSLFIKQTHSGSNSLGQYRL